MHAQPPLRCAGLLAGAIVFFAAASSRAQTPVAALAPVPSVPTAEVFPFEIGRATRDGVAYSIEATQPSGSKLTGQKVRLKLVQTTGFNRLTHYFTLATGRHKTVAEIDAVLVDVFRRFTTQAVVANQELGKIGDLSQGGEVRFVATSADDLRFDHLRPDAPAHSSHYRRADIAAFLAALTGAPPA